MRILLLVSTVGLATLVTAASAADMTAGTGSSGFDVFAAAPSELVAPSPEPDLVFEFGGGALYKPAYEGASRYTYGFTPIIGLDRLNIPGVIEIGGGDGAGLSFAPAFEIIGARKAVDNPELAGLTDIDNTYAVGARVGYGINLTENLTAEVYGQVLYAFGGTTGLLGEVGAKLTAELTPELEITGGVSADIASETYMDTYFGVTAADSVSTGGRYAAYDPAAGLKSVSLDLAARYEFIPDTFVNAGVTYTQYIGSAASSPIVQQGSASDFTVALGLSRKLRLSF